METSGSESKNKMDVLDLIIDTLREHEKHLDRLTERLESFLEAFNVKVEKEKPTEPTTLSEKTRPEPPPISSPISTVECVRWSDFREKSRKARVVTFEVSEKRLEISCAHADIVYRYTITFAPSSDKLRSWLSENLGVPEEKIVEGRITY
jgi:hypothetical protein